MKFGFKRPCVFFEETKFKMLNLSDRGQRSLNDLDLGLSYIVMYSFIWLYIHLQCIFTSQASIYSLSI